MAQSYLTRQRCCRLGATGVVVEIDVNRGLYLFQIVGLPDKAVEESRERVISAVRNALDKNIKAENEKVIVSLSPAELKKEGAYFDVAIALGYLVAGKTGTGEKAGPNGYDANRRVSSFAGVFPANERTTPLSRRFSPWSRPMAIMAPLSDSSRSSVS